MKDTLELYWKHFREYQGRLKENDTIDVLDNWIAELRADFIDLSTKIVEGKEFLNKLQNEIDALL